MANASTGTVQMFFKRLPRSPSHGQNVSKCRICLASPRCC